MIKILIAGILMSIAFSPGSWAQGTLRVDSVDLAGSESVWKGFARYDFQLGSRSVRLVAPSKPLPDNPWIWRARFPDWHTEADSILVSKGFHLVYLNTDNEYGSPGALLAWDQLYTHMTEKYQLNKKVALMGVSRGGLFIYNWAKINPEKVACIYAEAPVCDFKSWPMGTTGKGSAGDWDRLKNAYGFKSDEEALSYQNNPIDNLEPLARAKVPILHMIGLDDRVVPPENNTYPLVDQYIRLGGIATVVPCTKGPQNLEGHHFEIQTPKYVADFIMYHTVKNKLLDASIYHQLASGIQNSRAQFELKKQGRVAFLGGSITYNGGWRDSVTTYLTQKFPDAKLDFIPAGISSMGSTPSAFRLERDILSKGQVDLLFLEAAVNDATNERTDLEQVRAVEGIVRHLRCSNPAMDIIVMHFVDPDKMKMYRAGVEPEVIVNHNRVAQYYQLPVINLAKEVTDRIDQGEFTWEQDFKNLHPSPFGQGVYASSIIQFLDTSYSLSLDGDVEKHINTLPQILDVNCYDKGIIVDVSAARIAEGWNIDPSWKPNDDVGVRDNFVNVPMLVSENPGKPLKFQFEGNAVGIAVAAGPDAGTIAYRVDKENWQELNLFTGWSTQLHLPWYYTLATGLSSKKHSLEIRIVKAKDDNSTGNACRIRHFYVNLH